MILPEMIMNNLQPVCGGKVQCTQPHLTLQRRKLNMSITYPETYNDLSSALA